MALFNYGQEWWKQEMEKMLGIGSGKIQPTDLPEFKSLSQNMQTMGNQQNQNMMRQAIGQGIGGGSLASLLQGGNENIMKQLLAAIQQTYGQAHQRGAQGANTMLEWEKFNRQQKLQHLALQLQARAQRHGIAESKRARTTGLALDIGKLIALAVATYFVPAAAPLTTGMMAQTASGMGKNQGSIYGSKGEFDLGPMFDFDEFYKQSKF